MTERTDKQNALDTIKYLTDMLIADDVIIRNDLAENITKYHFEILRTEVDALEEWVANMVASKIDG